MRASLPESSTRWIAWLARGLAQRWSVLATFAALFAVFSCAPMAEAVTAQPFTITIIDNAPVVNDNFNAYITGGPTNDADINDGISGSYSKTAFDTLVLNTTTKVARVTMPSGTSTLYSYTPYAASAPFPYTDSFRYRVGSGGSATNAAVTVRYTRNQTITFGAIPNHVYGDAAFSVASLATVTDNVTNASSGQAITFSLVSGPATVSAVGQVTITGVGTVVVRADQVGTADYRAAPSVTQSFTVAKGTQTITFPAIAAQTFAVPNPTVALGASSTSGLAVTYSITSGPGSLSGSTLTCTGAGSIVVAANQAGDANWNAAAVVSQTCTVAKANQTITFAAIANQTYANPQPTVTLGASATSGLAIAYTVTGPATISGTTLTITGVGTVTVNANQAGNGNYNAATQVPQSFTVNPGTPVITFPALAGATYNASPNPTVALAATSNSGAAVSYAISGGTGTGSIAASTLTGTSAGTITVTASQAA
ncbi:MAG: hypothetical protein H0V44_16810, partial [Planctomycetes bacterium]|nr:hypothetical protein [Planctomycetota bacterium]